MKQKYKKPLIYKSKFLEITHPKKRLFIHLFDSRPSIGICYKSLKWFRFTTTFKIIKDFQLYFGVWQWGAYSKGKIIKLETELTTRNLEIKFFIFSIELFVFLGFIEKVELIKDDEETANVDNNSTLPGERLC